MSFARLLFDLLLQYTFEEEVSSGIYSLRDALVERVQFICEFVVSEHEYVSFSRFSIAIAAIRISLVEILNVDRIKENLENDENDSEELLLNPEEAQRIFELRNCFL